MDAKSKRQRLFDGTYVLADSNYENSNRTRRKTMICFMCRKAIAFTDDQPIVWTPVPGDLPLLFFHYDCRFADDYKEAWEEAFGSDRYKLLVQARESLDDSD